jgi:DNA-binding protein HU-beta
LEVLSVNKSELVEAIANESELSKADAERALNAFVSCIGTALKSGDTVQLVGFGTYSVSERGARVGKNPRTGEAIKIAARKVPKFAAGKGLKDLIGGAKKGAGASKGAAKGASKGAAKGGSKKK